MWEIRQIGPNLKSAKQTKINHPNLTGAKMWEIRQIGPSLKSAKTTKKIFQILL